MKTILIADDDRVLRQRLVHALGNAGDDLVLLEAGDGAAAVERLKDNAVGLVITDINMPRASGLVVLAYLNAFLPQVPCFVMTSYGTSRLKAKMPPDLLRFYQKPFDVQDMARSAGGGSGNEKLILRPAGGLPWFICWICPWLKG